MARVVANVRAAPAVPSYISYVGPDAEHVDATLKQCAGSNGGSFRGTFDVLSSHNAGSDSSATPKNWAALVAAAHSGGHADRGVWSSENPSCFSLPSCTQYSSMDAPLAAGVTGLVSWATLGDDVDIGSGNVTAKGADIAAGLCRFWGVGEACAAQ